MPEVYTCGVFLPGKRKVLTSQPWPLTQTQYSIPNSQVPGMLMWAVSLWASNSTWALHLPLEEVLGLVPYSQVLASETEFSYYPRNQGVFWGTSGSRDEMG